jgi:hypothetical protein
MKYDASSHSREIITDDSPIISATAGKKVKWTTQTDFIAGALVSLPWLSALSGCGSLWHG